MAEKVFKLHYPQNDLVDPMGSIIINVNTTVSPQFEWAYVNYLKGVGPVDASAEVNIRLVGFKDTTSYKIRYLEQITRHNSTSVTVGSSSCLTAPDSSACRGYGPYIIFGKRYFIDFVVLYFVNRTVMPPGGNEADYFIGSPIFSVDNSRCTPDYGIFIAAPKIRLSTLADPGIPYASATHGTASYNLFYPSTPTYTNELGLFNQNIRYRITALTTTSNSSYMDNVILTPSNIIDAVQNVIRNGQTSIVSVKEDNSPFILLPQTAGSATNFRPKSYYPFILFRYISEDAPTRRVFLSFSFAPNV